MSKEELQSFIDRTVVSKEEMFYAQARINIMSSVIVDLISIIMSTQPELVREAVVDVFEKWDVAEHKYPMQVDFFEEDDGVLDMPTSNEVH